MYTIEELTEIVNDGTLYVDIRQLARQLLDTMRQLEVLQARIEAAAAIEPQSTEDTEDDSYLWNSGYNAAFYEFRNALGLGWRNDI